MSSSLCLSSRKRSWPCPVPCPVASGSHIAMDTHQVAFGQKKQTMILSGNLIMCYRTWPIGDLPYSNIFKMVRLNSYLK